MVSRTGRHREPGSAGRISFVVGTTTLLLLTSTLATLVLTRAPSAVASATPTPGAVAAAGTDPPSAPTGDATHITPEPMAAPVGVLPPGARARVAADALRIRMAPSTTSETVATLSEGDVVYVAPGLAATQARVPPVSAEGYDWYYVHHVPSRSDWPQLEGHEDEVAGWMAAGAETERYVELLTPADCPADPGLADLVALAPYERVACLGDRTITLQGTYGCPDCDSLTYPGTFEPSWLGLYLLEMNWMTPGWETYPPFPGAITVVSAPDVPPFGPDARGRILRITGHFDDARSAGCVIAPGEPGAENPSHEEAAEWYCRERFVVESWEVVGDDPGWAAVAPDG